MFPNSRIGSIVLIGSLLLLGWVTSLHAEVWECGKGIYSTSPKFGVKCTPINSSIVCGQGHNKFIAPGRAGINESKESCTPTGRSESPFLNKALAKPVTFSFKNRTKSDLSSSDASLKSSSGIEALDCFLDYNGDLRRCGSGVGSWVDGVFNDVIGALGK